MAATMSDGDKIAAAILTRAALSNTSITQPREVVRQYGEIIKELRLAKLVAGMQGSLSEG